MFDPALKRLVRVRLSAVVVGSLFATYRAHRESSRSREEMAWLLLGYREPDEAVVTVALPAGDDRSAEATEVQFGPTTATEALALFAADDRLTVLGIVHTHPEDQNHPSTGDLKVDRRWVFQLLGGDGVFGIGVVQPGGGPNVLSSGSMAIHWYALAVGDRSYRKILVNVE